MGIDGAGLSRDSVRSDAACVTTSSGKVLGIYSALGRVLLCQRLVNMFCIGYVQYKTSIM